MIEYETNSRAHGTSGQRETRRKNICVRVNSKCDGHFTQNYFNRSRMGLGIAGAAIAAAVTDTSRSPWKFLHLFSFYYHFKCRISPLAPVSKTLRRRESRRREKEKCNKTIVVHDVEVLNGYSLASYRYSFRLHFSRFTSIFLR